MTHVAATGSPWARLVLSADDAHARVLHSGPDAVYIETHDEVVAVVSRAAVTVPCALQTTLPTMADLDPHGRIVGPGATVGIRDGQIHFDHAAVQIGRTVDYETPPLDAHDAPTMAARLAPETEEPIARILPELPSNALDGLLAADPEAVFGLIGLGSGLTPLGDDVVCGWLAAMVAAEHPCGEPIAERVAAVARARTTKLSATLLTRAVSGDVVPQFADLLTTLSDGGDVPAAVRALTEIGHTSGAGLALGLSLALDHLATRSNCE